MATEAKYRKKWLKYHAGYEKYAYKLLRSTFKKWNNIIINTDFKEETVHHQLKTAIEFESLYTTYYSIYYNIGSKHGARVGKDINLELKAFTMDSFMELFERNLPMFLRNYGITRIQQVHKTYLADIFKMFNDRLLDGKTLKETTDEVFKIMKAPRFYKWQAERIARTETTAAANYAAIQSGDVSGFQMQKHWISAFDARTRDPHAASNGDKVNQGQPFTVGGESLMYPGDPNGSAFNVINCRCTVAIIPKRDANGSLIRID